MLSATNAHFSRILASLSIAVFATLYGRAAGLMDFVAAGGGASAIKAEVLVQKEEAFDEKATADSDAAENPISLPSFPVFHRDDAVYQDSTVAFSAGATVSEPPKSFQEDAVYLKPNTGSATAVAGAALASFQEIAFSRKTNADSMVLLARVTDDARVVSQDAAMLTRDLQALGAAFADPGGRAGQRPAFVFGPEIPKAVTTFERDKQALLQGPIANAGITAPASFAVAAPATTAQAAAEVTAAGVAFGELQMPQPKWQTSQSPAGVELVGRNATETVEDDVTFCGEDAKVRCSTFMMLYTLNYQLSDPWATVHWAALAVLTITLCWCCYHFCFR
mmetsp:Transcript_73411/g.203857  ORF Transcript_73411/g.203857 Transcript_73411/m.203857 type:complete len:335 (+) Transcript_73411:31-1035(+)